MGTAIRQTCVLSSPNFISANKKVVVKLHLFITFDDQQQATVFTNCSMEKITVSGRNVYILYVRAQNETAASIETSPDNIWV